MLPTELQEVFRRFESQDESVLEAQLFHALQDYLRSNPGASSMIQDAVRAESFALTLCPEYAVGHNPWGTYFGPSMIFNGHHIPSLSDLTPRMLEYWAARSGEVEIPRLRARYADAVWDLTEKVASRRPDPRYARVAVDAYLDAVPQSNDSIQQFKWIRRALELSLSVNDRDRITRVRDTAFRLHTNAKSKSGTSFGLATLLFDTFFHQRKKVALGDAELDEIVQGLESELRERTNQNSKQWFHPQGAKWTAEKLIQFYSSVRRHDDVQRVVLQFGGAFEKAAEEAPPFVAHAWLEDVHRDYQQAGLRQKADSLLARIRQLGREACDQMPEITLEQSIDKSKFDSAIDALTSGGFDDARLKIVQAFTPRASQLRDLGPGANTLAGLVTVNILDELTRARIGPVEEDEEGRLVQQFAMHIDVQSVFLAPALEKLCERYGLTANLLVEKLYEAPVFEEIRKALFIRGIEFYLAGDWISAIHVLVPQIEHVFRTILFNIGGVTSKRKHEIYHERTLDDVLRDELLKTIWSEDKLRYFRTLLTDQRGQNIRNLTCHGLREAAWFDRRLADRLVHVLLSLSLIRAVKRV
jgi:Domain of unknown function (DUF4209)